MIGTRKAAPGPRRGSRNRPSEKKRASNRELARRPRGARPDQDERVMIDKAKALMRCALLPGAKLAIKIMQSRRSSPELVLSAFALIADRAGLPRVTQHEVAAEFMQIPTLELKGFKPPWANGHAENGRDAEGGDAPGDRGSDQPGDAGH